MKKNIDFDHVAAVLTDPALAQLGVTGRETIEILKQGNIRVDMFQRLLTADLVVADLSIHNANVFYELGIRHALRAKRTFLLRADIDEFPFDLKTDRYLVYAAAAPEKSLSRLVEALSHTLASEDSDSPVFASLPDLAEPERSRFHAVPRGFREEVGLAVAGRQAGDLRLLAAEAEGFAWENEGLRIVGRAQFDLKANHDAKETWEKIRRVDELDLEANTWLGTIYQRLDDLTRSDQAIQRVLDRKGLEPKDRAEAQALLARNAKSRWKDDWWEGLDDSLAARRERALRSPFLIQSADAYAAAFDEDLNHYFPGLNGFALAAVVVDLAVSLPQIWSERFESESAATAELERWKLRRDKLAAAVDLSISAQQARMAHEGEIDIWAEISAADLLCLTSQRPARVAAAYREALAAARDFPVSAVRDQLCIYEMLDIFPDNVAAALQECGPALPCAERPAKRPSTARVLLFSGHMIDAPNRAKPRFPPDKEDVARQAIQKAVESEMQRPGGVASGIAGGASGGDILFHEICAELGIATQLFLALPRNQFIAESVAPAGGDWRTRFDRLVARIEPHVLAESEDLPSWLVEKPHYDIWQRNNFWMLQNALAQGGENVTVLALWDGNAGDAPGGTSDLVALARQCHAEAIEIDSRKLFGLA